MRYLIFIFALLLAGQCLAGGSFMITSPNTTDVKMTYISSNSTLGNHGACSYMWVGNNYSLLRILLQFETLTDSMKQVVVDSGGVTWDSAVVTLIVYNATSVDDSIYISAYKILRTRVWVEGAGCGVDTCGACWDSANAINYSICSGVPADWGDNGCDNTSTDRSATRETCSSRPDSILLEDADATGVTKTFGISSATITDTLGSGLVFIPVWMTETSSPYGAFYSDDYGTVSYRPQIQVWYTLAGTGKRLGNVTLGKCGL